MTTGCDGPLGPGTPSVADALDRVDSFGHLADDRVVGWQADVGAGDDEELLTRRAGSLDLGLRHRDDTFHVLGAGRRRIDRLVAGPTRARLRGIASLDHEAGDDAVEDRVVVEPVACERHQRRCRVRRELGVEPDRERAAARLEDEAVARSAVERIGRRGERPWLAGSRRLHALALAVARRRGLVVPPAPGSEGEERDRKEQASHGVRSYPS